jgi:uncharacterized protein YwbE
MMAGVSIRRGLNPNLERGAQLGDDQRTGKTEQPTVEQAIQSARGHPPSAITAPERNDYQRSQFRVHAMTTDPLSPAFGSVR